MNRFEADRRFAQRMRDNYPPGTRIMLLQMGDDPHPIEPNTRGTVTVVDDMGTLHCNFDNGRQLGIVPGVDSFRRLTDQELAEENDSRKKQLTEMSEDELYERNIFRFDNFDDFFDFIYDENTDKADIINDMSQQMKRQIVSENYGERYIEADGAFYYNSECFTEMCSPQNDEQDMVSLLIQQLYREILAVVDENGGKLPNRAMFYCDEFGTLPPIQSAEMMYSASRSRRLSIVSIIQSYQQLEKNYGKEGAAIIQDNCQLTIAGGFAPSSETADIISKALGTRTVMTGSVSRSKNDPSQSLQMTERPLMTADELKSMKKGSFIVMKTGAHPCISKLKLFFKWGISFPENSYTIADKGARRVHYISRETLIKNITARYPQEKKPRVPTASPPSGGLTMTEPAEATFAQEVNHAAQQEKIAKPMRTG